MTARTSADVPFERRTRTGVEARVDVVLPFYNHGVFVEEALASVRRQTRAIDRVLVVDDGSTDGYSLEILARLDGEPGVEVLHQENKGPGAARNRGIFASTAEAVVLLDADDRMEDDHVAVALATLENARPSVGFAYPDQQSFGTLDDLMVMPAYNLHTLTEFNYCGTGCIVDRGVFDAGHAFAEDLRHGHEDWEFFLRIGAAGIEGTDFHGPALGWRRWGYSRSDGVNERALVYNDELRSLHPEVFEPSRLVALKQRWSPALSVMVDQVPATVAAQTCGDYEVVSFQGGAPEVRGRWVAALGDGAAGLLDDETFVERLLRVLVGDRNGAAVLLTTAHDVAGAVRWQRVPASGGSADGVVVDAVHYDRWRRAGGGADAASAVAALADETAPHSHWRWTGRPPTPGARRRGVGAEPVLQALPPPAAGSGPPALSLPHERQARAEQRWSEAAEKERSFRWGAAPLFVPTAGPRRRAAGPRRRWAPSPTVVLELVVLESGEAVLRAQRQGPGARDHEPRPGAPRITLGRLWDRGFPGTHAVYDRIDVHSHTHVYRVAAGPVAAGEARLGFAATEGMSGTTLLSERLDWGLAALAGLGIAVQPPLVEFEGAAVYLEPAGDDGPTPFLRRGRLAPYLDGAGGLGATLYELELTGGRVRYATHPDFAVAHPELGRAGGVAVAELGPADPTSAVPVLEEVPAGGGAVYVTGASGGEPSGARILGALSAGEGTGVALIRLHPGPSLPQAPDEAGYRLAVDWQPLGQLGYEPEGSVGFVWRVDPLEVPLYQWRRPDSTTQLLTLGERPAQGGWEFAGTLGMAWRPKATSSGLVGLWELSAGGHLVYAVDPAEFTALGFTCDRLVAKVSVARRPGSLPLWRTAVADDSPWRFTTCPADGEAQGFVRQGVIGYLLSAHPPPEPGDPRRQLTGDKPPRLASSAVPGALPVYLVADDQRRWATTTLDGNLERIVVEEVLGFLPPD